jgi:dihydrofolate synthase / folylpolyglutamate synthase
MSTGKGDYQRTLAYLYGLQKRGIKYGLKNIRGLVTAYGHPERHFAALHIAGTNGKGSTASFLASMLKEAGYRTGLYTSPHLVRFNERIRIDGVPISDEHLVAYARAMRPDIEKHSATFFEATTCIAFRYFADEHVDVAVIETGLGGRLDATNVVTPMVSVITNIAMDHMEYLGTTLSAIAREKAGIIKRGIPVVTASTSDEALRVLRSVARRRGSPFHHAWEIASIRMDNTRRSGTQVRLGVQGWRIPPVTLGLSGEHQLTNAALAVSALSLAAEVGTLARINGVVIARGLHNVARNTGLEGRLQQMKFRGIEIILDVAHNPDGMRTLADELSGRHVAFPLAVFGIVRDKDAGLVLEELRRTTREIIAVTPETERARPGREVARMATERGILAVDGGSVRAGLMMAVKRLTYETAPARKRLLVAGSHYVVGEALEFLKGATAGK